MKKVKEVGATMPRILLHIEGLVVFIGSLIVYNVLDGSWALFILLFLVPDISFFAYFGGPKFGARVYNVFHTCVIPFIVFLVSVINSNQLGMHVAVIWFAHIGADRLMGYGFKYPRGFKTSHMKQV